MHSKIKKLSAWGLKALEPLELFLITLGECVAPQPFRWSEIIRQAYESAVASAPMILFCISIVSLMGVIEFSWHMKKVLNEDALVPAFAMVLTIREVGPVVTAMLLASRLGASIAAELGIMKMTEQLDQLKLLAVSPIQFLIVPRWIGCLLATISLTVLSIAVSVLVSSVFASRFLGYQPREFYNLLFVFARGVDLWGALLKACVFGTVIPFVASASGLGGEAGSAGIGQAATRAVVKSSLIIIILDFFINSVLWIS